MTTPVSPVAALFDALAATYDGVGVDFFQPIAGGLVSAMNPQLGENWLDIGCGRGAVLLPIAEAIGDRGTALGTDISPRMVEQALALAAESGRTNISVRVDDAQAPTLGDQTFDAITSCLVLFFLMEPADALRAWLPLLKPGGRLGVTTFGGVDPRWENVDSVFEPYLPSAMKDARTSGKAGPFSSDAGVEALLHGAGFTDIRTVVATVQVRFVDTAQWEAFTWSTGQRAMWLAIPEDLRPGVRAEAERRLTEIAQTDGSVVFQQSVRHTLGARPA